MPRPRTPGRTLLVVADRIHAGAANGPDPLKANAVLIRDGRIAAVGLADGLRRIAGSVPTLDLPGATITPGLADAHIHLTEWAFARRELDLTDARDPEHAADLVEAQAPTGGWIRGRGWNPHRWGGESPHRRTLDRRFPERPVALQSHDMHALWVNAEALRRAGIDAETPDPADGRIVRDEHGEPTGLLLESAARLVVDRMPPPSFDDAVAAVLDAQRALHALGITAVHSFPGIHVRDPDPLPVLEALRARDLLRLRVLHHIALEKLDHAIALGLRSGFGGEWIRIGGVKIFLDGALGSRTAWMREPYEGEAQCGMRVLDPEDFLHTVKRAAGAGIASTVHAIGDAAVALALDVLTRDALRVEGLPHRIEHVQCCPADLLPRTGLGGIVCSMQPAHLITDWTAADRHWGERARWTYAFRSLLEHGARLAFGSDAPVEPVDPRLAFHAALTRTDLAHRPEDGWYARERITAAQVLEAYTAGPAAAAGAVGWLGSLTPGAAGDLAAWDADPLTLRDAAGALGLMCRATVVAGEIVYSVPSH